MQILTEVSTPKSRVSMVDRSTCPSQCYFWPHKSPHQMASHSLFLATLTGWMNMKDGRTDRPRYSNICCNSWHHLCFQQHWLRKLRTSLVLLEFDFAHLQVRSSVLCAVEQISNCSDDRLSFYRHAGCVVDCSCFVGL